MRLFDMRLLTLVIGLAALTGLGTGIAQAADCPDGARNGAGTCGATETASGDRIGDAPFPAAYHAYRFSAIVMTGGGTGPQAAPYTFPTLPSLSSEDGQ